MGNRNSSGIHTPILPEDRNIYAKCLEFKKLSSSFSSFYIYKLKIAHKRFSWIIYRRHNEILSISALLHTKYPHEVEAIMTPRKYKRLFFRDDPEIIKIRGLNIATYLEELGANAVIFNSPEFREFLEVGSTSLCPELGRKGKSGYLKKHSGGYVIHGTKGDGLFSNWRLRWVVLHDTYIAYHKTHDNPTMQGFIAIDKGFSCQSYGRYVTITTLSRSFRLYAPTARIASEWKESILDFYNAHPRCTPQDHDSSFPNRTDNSVEVFTCSRDYYFEVANALLGAKYDIFISSWKLSPTLWLTRPPLPPTRLDQILKFKADQGVKIYILLYKEVEYSPQGNHSLKAKKYLENLSPNIRCIRHPDKFFGSSKAIMWSHHEKLVVVDRMRAFVGGLDLAFNRYDDFTHSIVDEIGSRFPGVDYRQSAKGLFQPVRTVEHLREMYAFNDKRTSQAIYQTEAEVINLPTEVEININATRHVCPIDQPGTSEPHGDEQTWHTNQQTYRINYGEDEDLDAPETDEERNARLAAEHDANTVEVQAVAVDDLLHMQHSDIEIFNMSLMEGNVEEEKDKTLFSSLYNAFVGTLDVISGMLTEPRQEYVDSLRYLYPRTAWHDVHAMISGIAAVDVSSHFVQRWNYHRQVKEELHEDVLTDITDDDAFSICARCESSNIKNEFVLCHVCGLDLGSHSKYICNSNEVNQFAPKQVAEYSFIVFSCQLFDKLGCHIYGDGPVTVEKIYSSTSNVMPGKLLFSAGIYKDSLIERGLLPSIADVIVSINGIGVTHLNVFEVTRIIRQQLERVSGAPIVITFRRHHIQSVVNAYNMTKTQQIEFSRPSGHMVGSPKLSQSSPVKVETPLSNSITFNERIPSSNYSCNAGDPMLLADNYSNTHNIDSPFAERQQNVFAEFKETDQSLPSNESYIYPNIFSQHTLTGQGIEDPFFSVLQDVSFVSENPGQTESVITDEMRNLLSLKPNLEVEEMSPSYDSIVQQQITNALDDTEAMEVIADGHLIPISEISELNLPDVPQNAPVIMPNVPNHIPELLFQEDRVYEKKSLASLGFNRDYVLKASSKSGSNESKMPEISTFSNHIEFPSPPSYEDAISTNESNLYPNVPPQVNIQQFALAPTSSDPSSNTIGVNLDDSSFLPTQMLWGDVDELVSIHESTCDHSYLQIPSLQLSSACFPENKCRFACVEAISIENRFSMSNIFHEKRPMPGLYLPTPIKSSSCHVQVLRSVGHWSLGRQKENSIQNAWISAIEKANKLIYIENQFFIGECGTTGKIVLHGVLEALLNRLVLAVQNMQAFRVIVILPQHPSGDYLNSESPRIILHYELQSICRGSSSLIELFRQRCPNVDPFEYINFFCLKNWGVMNGKVVCEQIYVHDKLLIVDDRVVIIGSANLNDRSMRGDRDSEVAIRIEDSNLWEIVLGNESWKVGVLPHTLRMNLMRQHIGDMNSLSVDLMDICTPLGPYSAYHNIWLGVAYSNKEIFDALEGPTSIYKCKSLHQLGAGIETFVHKSIYDAQVAASIDRIRGFLVPWPLDFLCEDDISPGAAAKAFIPLDLWL